MYGIKRQLFVMYNERRRLPIKTVNMNGRKPEEYENLHDPG